MTRSCWTSARSSPSRRMRRIIHIDQFGNCTTNLGHDVLQTATVRGVRIKGLTLGRVRRTYWDVAPGKPLALIGSSGLLEMRCTMDRRRTI